MQEDEKHYHDGRLYVLKKQNMKYFITYLFTLFDKEKFEDGWFTDSSSSEEVYDSDEAEQDVIKEREKISIDLRLLNA